MFQQQEIHNAEQERSIKKRLSLACNVCRRKKIKCDGVKPTCGKCVRFNQECTYTTSVKKRGPRQGHIELLEKRLKKMEELMTAGDGTTTTSTPLLPVTPIQPRVPQLDYQTTLTPTTYMIDDISSETVEHLLDLFFIHLAVVSPIADIQAFRASVRNKSCNAFLLYSMLAASARFSKRPDIVEQPLWMSGEKYAIKARNMLADVIEQGSIEHVQGLLMLTIHEYGSGRGPRCWTYTGLGIRMAIEQGLHKEAIFEEAPGTIIPLEKWYWYETRRKIFWSVFMHDKFSSAATGRPPILDPNDCETMMPIDYDVVEAAEEKDIYQSSLSGYKLVHYHIIQDPMTNKITGIHFNPLNAQLPENKLYLSRVGWGSRILQESAILGKVTQLVNRGYNVENGVYGPYQENSEFAKLDRELDQWTDKLPMHCRNTPANLEHIRLRNNKYKSAKFVLAHILHNALVVLLNRPSLVIADMPGLGQVTQSVQDKVHISVEKCIAAADNVTVMLKDLCCQIDVIPPFITYLVYTTATVMVNSSFSSNPVESQKAKSALNEYFRVLLEMKKYWAMADLLYCMIQDLYSVHQKVLDLNQSPSTSSQCPASPAFDAQQTIYHTPNTVYPYANVPPAPIYNNPTTTIPMRKLPMAEVSMSTSDWTINQNWEYNAMLDTSTNNNNNASFQGVRRKSLFTDSSISSFDLWIQQQQQQQKPQ